MRKTAMQILLLWLFSTSAFAMQQCCEILAGADSHHTEQSLPKTIGADHHASHGGADSAGIDSHHGDESEHCPTISADLSDVPLLAPSCSTQLDKKATAVLSREHTAVQRYTSLLRPGNSRWVVNRRSIYLDTQRFRI